MTERTVLFVGAPGVGKSNYLFRLWIALRDGQHRRLKPNGTPDDLEYLKGGANAQLRGEYAQRTLGDVIERPNLPLLLDGEPVTLVAPDRPGEDWDRLYAERRWPTGWADLLGAATSYLVFVPTKDAVQIPDWIAVQAFRGAHQNFKTMKDHSTSKPPTQVVICDWIQMILAAQRRATHWESACASRIGIVVSAWDRVSKQEPNLTPTAYLKREYRLLHDFIMNGSAGAETRVFGVSLYGDDLNDATFRETLINGAEPPHTLGYVIEELDGQSSSTSDLAVPVTWALGAI